VFGSDVIACPFRRIGGNGFRFFGNRSNSQVSVKMPVTPDLKEKMKLITSPGFMTFLAW